MQLSEFHFRMHLLQKIYRLASELPKSLKIRLIDSGNEHVQRRMQGSVVELPKIAIHRLVK